MQNGEESNELSEETITTLFTASPETRDYLSKAIADYPLDVAEEWKDERPEDFERLQQEDSIRIALSLNSGFDEFYITDREPESQVEIDFLNSISDRVFEEVRNVQRQSTLTANEFAIFLLAQGAEWSDAEIANTLDIDTQDVRAKQDCARDKFQQSLRTIDLAGRFADATLRSELEQWSAYSNPIE